MKRKILVTLLAFCLIASLCVVGAAADGNTLPEAVDGVITLEGNLTITSVDLKNALDSALSTNSELIIDLAQNTLEITQMAGEEPSAVRIKENAILTIKNGKITANNQKHGSHSVLVPLAGTALTLDNVIMETNGTALYPAGNAASVVVKDSNITAGVYVVGTNASVKNGELVYSQNVRIELLNSTLSATGNEGVRSTCTVMINVPGTLVVDECTITGGSHAVLVRGGAATITNSDISLVNPPSSKEYEQYENGNWGSGNGVPMAAIVIGNRVNANGDYHYPASCEIANTSVSAPDDSINSAYIYQMPSDNNNDRKVTVDITSGDFGKISINKDASIKEKVDVTVTGGTFSEPGNIQAYFPTNSALTFDENGKVVTDDKTAVAEVNNVPYKTLQAAIDAAEGGDTVTLVADVTDANVGTPKDNADGEQTTLIIEKDITINGNNHSITLTVPADADDTRNQVISVGHKTEKPATLTLSGVSLTINGKEAGGDAFDVWAGSTLNVNNSTLTFKGLTSAFTMQGGAEAKANITNTTINGDIPHGNFSNGGAWVIEDSNVTITNCATHGLSVGTAVIDNSSVSISKAGYCGIMGTDISIINGSKVTVTGSGSALPQDSQWAPNGDAYNYAVELKKNGELTVEDATLTLSGNVNTNGAAIDNIFVSEGTTTDTANGTVNAGFVVAEGSNQLVVRMMDGNVQYSNQTVTKGDSVYLPTLSKSGYTFTGWRVNDSNTIVRGSESYTITANTTFTAVWNMIMIPDTYDIAVDQPAHGTVDVSFSNASQGSVITVTATPDEGYELVYITVDGEPISGNSFVMPDHAVEVSALFAEIGKEVNFVDVSRADWFYDYVQYVAQNGLMEGTTRTAFEPNASMTRAMFWTVLARIDGETITGDAWKTLAQTWAVESGISDGTNADALITREQMVTMLYRFANSPEVAATGFGQFTDGASVSDYATDAVTWALSEGILTGMGDGILAPQGTATRAQAAAMLMRFVEA